MRKFPLLVIIAVAAIAFKANAQYGIGVNTRAPKSTLDVNGSLGLKTDTVTASLTLDTSKCVVVGRNSSNIVVTLPTVAGNRGRTYQIKRGGSANITVTPQTGNSVDGYATWVLDQTNEYVNIASDGNAKWIVVGAGVTNPEGSYWGTLGNANTVDGTNFIGTTDDIPLTLKVNGQKSARIGSSLEYNTMFGYKAGNVNTFNGSTFIGYSAGSLNTSGSYNVAVGREALKANVNGNGNTAVGYQSLLISKDGTDNTAIGNGALIGNVHGNQNTAVGSGTLNGVRAATGNTAIGQQSMFFDTSGTYNTALGVNSLRNLYAGDYNIAIGYNSLLNTSAATADENIAIGHNAGNTNTTGLNNTIIGGTADVNTAAITNGTAIGFGAKVGSNNTVVLGNTSVNNLGLGVVTPTYSFSFNGSAAKTIALERHASLNGSALTVQGGGGASGVADKNGGDLNLNSGIATGTGSSKISFSTATAQGSTSTTDNSPTVKMTILGSGNVGIATTTPGEKLEVTGNVKTQHIIGSTSAPSNGGLGTGAGTSPTFTSITGNDMGGKISFTTGSAPAAGANVITVTFATPYSVAPYVTITAGNASTASITKPCYISAVTTTGFTITTPAGVSMPASTAQIFYYTVVQ